MRQITSSRDSRPLGDLMNRGLNIRAEAIEATLEEIRKDTPKAVQAKPGDFVDLRFVTELKQSVYVIEFGNNTVLALRVGGKHS